MGRVLKSFGVRIRRVPDIEEGAIYIAEDRLLILDCELDAASVRAAIEETITYLREVA